MTPDDEHRSNDTARADNPRMDAGLRAVCEAWDTLPEPVKAGIVAMVKSVQGGVHNR